jgi:formamidopyrimidine-DNA glycosylase
MPELPEVETIRKSLEKYLLGHRVEKVEVLYKKSLESGGKKLEGGVVKKVRRFGKALVIDFDNNYSAIIHVKMSGQLIYKGINSKKSLKMSKKVVGGVPGKHTRVIFHLDKDSSLYFNDVRKFGWVKVVKKEAVEKVGFIKKLGPEIFNGLTLSKFKEIVSSTKRPIKTLLMDQSKIAGIGNIYANDALWLARINPKTPSNNLKGNEVISLYKAIEKVLRSALKHKGTSDRFYVAPDGSEGKYQNNVLVYSKQGVVCVRCRKTKIEKIKLGGRGTYYCPLCQS